MWIAANLPGPGSRCEHHLPYDLVLWTSPAPEAGSATTGCTAGARAWPCRCGSSPSSPCSPSIASFGGSATRLSAAARRAGRCRVGGIHAVQHAGRRPAEGDRRRRTEGAIVIATLMLAALMVLFGFLTVITTPEAAPALSRTGQRRTTQPTHPAAAPSVDAQRDDPDVPRDTVAQVVGLERRAPPAADTAADRRPAVAVGPRPARRTGSPPWRRPPADRDGADRASRAEVGADPAAGDRAGCARDREGGRSRAAAAPAAAPRAGSGRRTSRRRRRTSGRAGRAGAPTTTPCPSPGSAGRPASAGCAGRPRARSPDGPGRGRPGPGRAGRTPARRRRWCRARVPGAS